MASYAKQMRELAAKWLESNPDPQDAFVRAPGLAQEFSSKSLDFDRDVTDLRTRFAQEAQESPEIQEMLTELETMTARRMQLTDEIRGITNNLDEIVNTPPEATRGKYTADPELTLGPWCLAWARYGYNSFELSSDFTAAMLLTNPTEIDVQSIRLPFRGLLLTIPTGFARGVEGTDYTKIHIWEATGEQIKLLRVGAQIRSELAPFNQPARQRMLDSLAKHIDEHKDRRVLVSKTGAPWILIHATDGVRAFLISVEMENLTWQAIEELPEDNIDNETDRHVRHTIQQLVFGTLAYLVAVKDAATPRVVQRKLKKPIAVTVDEIKHWEIGRTVKIDPYLVQIARGGSREIAFRIKNRFIVRGHYRNQACGPKLTEHRRIYIEPFYKGPDEGARIVHTYKPELADE